MIDFAAEVSQMNTHNLQALKEFLHQTITLFSTEGVVYQKDKIVSDATETMRDTFVGFHDEIAHAQTFREIGRLANEARRLSLANNFFLPRKRVAFYERLVAVKVMDDEALLENVEWWRAASFQREK